MGLHNVYILVADSAHARLLERDVPGHKMKLVREAVNPFGRGKVSDRMSDAAGRTFDSNGLGARHAIEPSTDPKEVEREKYARYLATMLAGTERSYDSLVLVAPPRFLGELREALPASVRGKVVGEVQKELTHLTLPQLEEHLTGALPN